MNNEGWIYIGWDSKDDEYVKIGLTGNNNTYGRSHSSQNPDYGIELAVQVDNYKEIECIIHNLFERKPFRKTKNKSEFCKTTLEQIFPLFLILANDIKIDDEKRGQTFIRVAEMVENKLEQYKKIAKPFVVNKINKLLKDGGVPVEDFCVAEEQQIEKQNSKKQPKPQNKVCKYEEPNKTRTTINWNLFFNDNQQLLHKNVFVDKNKNNIGEIAELSNGRYGILFKNKEMSFMDFCKFNGHTNCCAYDHIYFLDTNKTIKQTYEEVKFK